MNINWDFLISALILIWLGLVIAARVTKQNVPELLNGMKDFITGRGGDAIEGGEDLLYYD